MKYCISVDWYQVFCLNLKRRSLEFHERIQGIHKYKDGYLQMYEVRQAEEFHAIYRNSYTIYWKNHSMVHIFTEPKMASLDPKSVSVKVANRLLYKCDWSWFLHDIIDAIGYTLKNITRIDLCMDFQRFAFEDMTPTTFISRYTKNSNSKDDTSYVREGSNNFCIYGSKLVKATDGSKEITDNTEVDVVTDFEYIKFGSRSSGVCTYLYNKSKELRDKKSKPWIRDRWIEAGLDEEEGDIYRLEFSIASKGMNLKKTDRKKGMKSPSAAQTRRVCRSDFETQLAMEELFISYQHKYFSFRICGGQKYRKDMKPLHLFDFELVPTMLPSYYNSKINAGRAERNAGAVIQRLQWQVQDMTPKQYKILAEAQNILESLSVQIRQLKDEDVKYPIHLNRTPFFEPFLQCREVIKAVDEAVASSIMLREDASWFDAARFEEENTYN